MRNARETTGTASAANHLEHLNHAAPTPRRLGIGVKANQFAERVALRSLRKLEAITEPLRIVTECNHTSGCHTVLPN